MGNSLLDIKPHKVSRDLRGYSIMFYGEPKSGKTTISSQFPGALVLAFEKGYNAIAGIMAKPMNSWNDFKKTLVELKDPAVKEIFQTVVIDTADIAYGLCEKYICSRESDAKNNYELLFFAAKTLGENGRHRAALEKYALFPQESPYQIAVWLNMAELYAESGNADQALILAQRAYNKAPQMPETQLCYADKLHRKGRFEQIPDIVKLSSAARYRKPMEKLWIAGIEHRIKKYDINTQREKIRELCRQLKVIAPDNAVALEYTKKLNKMPQ
jgi:tetratricopeptide (TPR) repeat protein